jgi:hypothetical protein
MRAIVAWARCVTSQLQLVGVEAGGGQVGGVEVETVGLRAQRNLVGKQRLRLLARRTGADRAHQLQVQALALADSASASASISWAWGMASPDQGCWGICATSARCCCSIMSRFLRASV